MTYRCRCERHDRETEKNQAKKVLKIIGFVILGIAAVVFFGFVIKWLWNWLMPEIFGLTAISYWQAVGIFILSKIIFGGFSGSSEDSDKKPKGAIKKEIAAEINKEIDKEFDKKHEGHEQENDNYDEMYEKWWKTKGEKNFEEFMSDVEDKNEQE